MSVTATQICEQFQTLSDDERIQVLHQLWESMPDQSEELEELLSEAEARSVEMSSGRVQGVSWTEAQKQLDQILAS